MLLQEVDGHIGDMRVTLCTATEPYLRAVQNLETADLRSAVGQVPAARPGGLVTGAGEEFSQIGDSRVGRKTVYQYPVFVRQATGDQAAARGAAHRCGAIGLLETNARGGQRVHVRCMQMGVASATKRTVRLLVGDE